MRLVRRLEKALILVLTMPSRINNFLVILLLSCLSLASAGTYYIDPYAAHNGDGSRGTPASAPGEPGAFNTWPQYFSSTGDRYYQKCSTTFRIPWQYGIELGNRDGSEGFATIFGAYYLDRNNQEVIGVSGEKPIITGLATLAGWDEESNWSNRGNNIWAWEIGAIHPRRLWIDGIERLMAGFDPLSESAEVHGVARIDPYGSPEIFWSHDIYPSDGSGDIGETFYIYSEGNPATAYSSMEGLQATDRAFTIRNSDYVIIENLDIRAAKVCIAVDWSNHVTIQNCDIGIDGNIGIQVLGAIIAGEALSADYGVIAGCLIDSDFHFPGYLYESQGPNDGIAMRDGANHWRIYNNRIRNWGHSCINISSTWNAFPSLTSNNNLVYENFLTAPDASHCRAFNLESRTYGRCSKNEVYLNYIYDVPTRSQVSADHNEIYYNIFDTISNEFYYFNNQIWKSSGDGLQLWAGASSQNCEFNKIYNNVFYNTGEAGIRLISWGDQMRVQLNEIANNILFDCGLNAKFGRESFSSYEYAGAAIVIEAFVATDDHLLSDNIFRNNLIHNSDSGYLVRYKGTSMRVSNFNFSATDSDLAENNLDAHPRFRNAAGGDFALEPHSGAIAMGYNLGAKYKNAFAPEITRDDWNAPIATTQQNEIWDIGAIRHIENHTAVEEYRNEIPQNFALLGNYPNPFLTPPGRGKTHHSGNPGTTIQFDLPETVYVKLAIYNTSGQLVRSLISSQLAAGRHRAAWDGLNESGVRVATGLYLYRIEAGSFVSMKKMILAK